METIMTSINRVVWLTTACTAIAFPSLLQADGGFFYLTGEAADLAQTRQEAVLAVHPDGTKVTYVLRSLYNGDASEFAWVMPVAATPTDVVAHPNSTLFASLDQATRPTFMLMPAYTGGGGCACGGLGGAGGTTTDAIVQVEAGGKAGIYDWAALTSSGSGALLDWLNTNGFATPTSAAAVLDGYIGQGMHFLAVRVREGAAPAAGGASEIPPIQFTVETNRRFYPMTISQVSAAQETEVILYVLASHREEAANLPNGLIDSNSLVVDFSSESGTNYEQLFTQKIAALGGLALITEYASRAPNYMLPWPQVPADLAGKRLYLTRMRTLIPRDRMTQDFEFGDAVDDTEVSSVFTVTEATQASAGVGQMLTALAAVSLFCGLLRWSHRGLAHGRH
jgi:hypothetical protein